VNPADEGRPPGAPATNHLTTRDHTQPAARSSIVVALEALEDGDVRLAIDVLAGALEQDGQTSRRYRCRICGVRLEWPGLRERHELLIHGEAAA